jgi:predicted DNA-binding protein
VWADTSVFLRMGQTLGQLKDRYIHSAEGAGQLCGRMVSGLPFDSELFTVLPPHFTKRTLQQMDTEYWNSILSDYSEYPSGLKTALPYFLASLIHHESFLRANLDQAHPVFVSRVFTHNRLLSAMRDSVLLGFGLSVGTDMRATGIPPHLALAERLHSLSEDTRRLHAEVIHLKQHINEVLPHKVASTVTEQIQENFVVEGVAPVSMRLIDQHLSAMEDRLIARANQPNTTLPTTATESGPEQVWRTWDWNDGLIAHFVPKGWEFPARLTVKMLWDLWWFGDRSTGIRPLSKINFEVELLQHRMRQSRAKSVIEYCVGIVNDARLLPDRVSAVSSLSVGQSDTVFDSMYEQLIQNLYPPDRMPGIPLEICYGTVYNLKPKPARGRRIRRS